MDYEMNTGRFEYEWSVPGAGVEQRQPGSTSVENPPLSLPPTSTPLNSHTTEIFIPSLVSSGRKLRVTGVSPSEYVHDDAHQTLYITPKECSAGAKFRVVVEFEPPLEPVFELNDIWSDFGGKLASVGFIFLAVIVALFRLQT
jgi:hypothetical protein